jgi:hypothetical protein
MSNQLNQSNINPVHFVMTCEGISPGTSVTPISEWNGPPWMMGEIITREVPRPFIFNLDPEYPGKMKPMYEGGILLMRDDLLSALSNAGVDNLQVFPALIRDKKNGQDYENYKAVNIIGVIACADMAQSVRMDPEDDDSDIIDVNFDSLFIDEKKARGSLLFRLAESVSAIIVHQQVRDLVEKNVPGMTFYGPGEWSG